VRNGAWRTTLPFSVFTIAVMLAIGFGAWAAVENRRYAERVAHIDMERDVDARRRRGEINEFLVLTCEQDAQRGVILITVIQQAADNARKRGDRASQRRYDTAIQDLLSLNDRCIRSLPANTPDPP
jgi:hypothetical protein